MNLPIPDRTAAGKALAKQLSDCKGRDDVIVLALPRGGVPVAVEIARTLGVQMDILVVRKLGLPVHRELAMGAIASGGVRVINEDVVKSYAVPRKDLESVTALEKTELRRREQTYRGDRPWPDLMNRCVILVDDGVATGATMIAAIDAVRRQHASEIRVAVPVSPPDTLQKLRERADAVVCLETPEPFYAIGQWYRVFDQLTDDEVVDLIHLAWKGDIEG